MSEFGSRLKELRLAAGWRQEDLVYRLGGVFARSTLANVETGREPPSPKLWSTLVQQLPDWVDELSPHLTKPPPKLATAGRVKQLLGGPFVVESVRFVYVFRDSKSPEEILEIRRVRATSAADGYGLKLSHTGSDGFRVDEEVLWGGDLVDADHHDSTGRTVYLRRLHFGKTLRRGHSHEFALRSWVSRDPEPCTEIHVEMSIPCELIYLDAHFLGSHTPASCWQFGPVADESLVPTRGDEEHSALTSDGRRASARFANPDPGALHGLRWEW